MRPVPAERPEAFCYHVVPGCHDGWDVIVERQQHLVSSTHCSDWHRVERICAALERRRRGEHTQRSVDVSPSPRDAEPLPVFGERGAAVLGVGEICGDAAA